jgi:hypothetical protein
MGPSVRKTLHDSLFFQFVVLNLDFILRMNHNRLPTAAISKNAANNRKNFFPNSGKPSLSVFVEKTLTSRILHLY